MEGNVSTIRGVRAAMRDGVELVADIYTPTGEGPWPVLLMRQPYGRDIASTVVYAQPIWFCRQGYIVVVQDVRGRGDSPGKFYAFRNEANDGYDTVMWAAGLAGSNGKVGMYGFSYQGSTQLLAAAQKPDPLKAIAPHMTAFDLYSGWFYRDGLLQLNTTLGWGNQMLREDARRSGNSGLYEKLETSWRNPGELCHQFPLAEAKPVAMEDSYVRDWLQHDRANDYWQEFNLLKHASNFEIPMFHLSGWYDYYLRGTMDGYRACLNSNASEQFIVCGPWIHIPWGRIVGGADLGAEARLDTDALLVAWFDHWLKGKPRDDRTKGVTYFVLGENRWHTAAHWPPSGAVEQSFFLTSGGRANSAYGDGALSRQAASGLSDQFNYDPEVPVLAPGGQMNGALSWGPADLSAAQQGNNLLVYTIRFDKPFRMVGRARCRLYFESSAECTAFVVRLSRVTRTGSALFLTLGAVQTSASPTAGTPRECLIELDDCACSFEAGEGLRLDVSSSAFPLLARHPNTPASANRLASPGEFRRAHQTIFHDALRPSRVEIPSLP